MLYTIYSGPINHLRGSLLKTGSLGLPLLALGFLLVAAFSFTSSSSADKNPYIAPPQKVGNPSKQTAALPVASNSATSNPSSPQLQLSGVTSPVSGIQSGTTVIPSTGGMGGGDTTPLTTAPTPPAPTVACTDLLSISQVCTACTPPLTLQPGQKALLSSDGTCVAAN